MNIDNIINSNVLGIAGFNKDFYALVGSSIVLFNMTHYLLTHYLKKIDPNVDQEKLLSNSAGWTTCNVVSSYENGNVKQTVDWYEKLVDDRNKIAHGFIVKQSNGKTIYRYILKKSKKRLKVEEGELDEQFFLEFIDSCNMFIGAIVIQDPEMKEKYGLFEEIK